MEDVDIEGAVTRSLFRTNSDSEEEEEANVEQSVAAASNNHNDELQSLASKNVRRKIMHVLLEEQQTGASIAQRLWPAAEHLAQFVLDTVAPSDGAANGSNSTVPVTPSTRSERQQAALESLKKILRCDDNESSFISMLELGAGIGLTGIELATQLRATVLLTDLDEGLPLLQTNTVLNRERYQLGPHDTVQVRKLAWGNEEDCQYALEWHEKGAAQPSDPLLILGSDCVYHAHLHEPLEVTLCRILSSAPSGSVCLLAGMRRWKRDNTFYQSLGKRTRTQTHELQCTCLKETVRREGSEREIMRVYAVQWVQRQRKQKV
jgi:hypothetical protein